MLRDATFARKAKQPVLIHKGPFRRILTTHSLELLSIDLIGPLPRSRGGVQYILTVVDHFSKFTKLYSLQRATTQAIIYKIRKDFIAQYGTPKKVISDNGPQFTSKQWTNTLTQQGIQVGYTKPYHPQANPVERINREVIRILRTFCHQRHTKWANWLAFTEKSINQTHSEVTQYTPYEILTGRRVHQPIENITAFHHKPLRHITKLSARSSFALPKMPGFGYKNINKRPRLNTNIT